MRFLKKLKRTVYNKLRTKHSRKSSSDWKGFQETFQALRERLKEPKPGLKAQLRMATNPRPGHRAYHEVAESSVNAGILVLLYPWRNKLNLVLTKRTAQLDHHQAQISFPGGRQEEGENLHQTALREACEELNIPPASIHILGELTPLYVPPSNFCIYPMVAAAYRRPDFQPSAQEVDEVIEVPLDHLLDPENIHREMWVLQERDVEVSFYLYKGYKIWGATAMVIAELLEFWRRFQKESSIPMN